MTDRRVVLVTGSTDGIGRATVRALAAGGAKVLVHGRSRPKVDAAVAALREELPGAELDGVSFDLGSLASVRRGAEQVLAHAPELHVLVANAGIYAHERVLTGDGIELTFAVCHVGHFLLAELLAPRLVASATHERSRVILVASVAHGSGRLALDDLTLAHSWTGYEAYARAKLANVMHAAEFAAHHDPAKLVAYALHPGVIGTKLLREGWGPVRGASVEVGARNVARLAVGEVVEPPGTYFSEGTPTPPASPARDAAARAALWDASVRLAKL
jgi:NAD(P)-dependent dehydrogenase (short-subunit alcohol dehydrogenase family)